MRESFIAMLALKDGINWAGAPSVAFEAVTEPDSPCAAAR
jgi:hypothetical protein